MLLPRPGHLSNLNNRRSLINLTTDYVTGQPILDAPATLPDGVRQNDNLYRDIGSYLCCVRRHFPAILHDELLADSPALIFRTSGSGIHRG